MREFVAGENSILHVVKRHLNGAIKSFIKKKKQKITDLLQLQETIFIKKLLIDINLLKIKKKKKKSKKNKKKVKLKNIRKTKTLRKKVKKKQKSLILKTNSTSS